MGWEALFRLILATLFGASDVSGDEGVEQPVADEPQLVCGVEDVEDLVAVPRSRWLIGSGMGDSRFQSGALHLVDTRSDEAFPVELDLEPELMPQEPYAACDGPPDASLFSAHGLSLVDQGHRSSRLYVVNHGGRESVEVFEVLSHGSHAPSIEWIGCVPAPVASLSANSVAARSDGSLVLSSTLTVEHFDPNRMQEQLNNAEITGALYLWEPSTGWSEIPGSALPGNNGVVLSDDERWAFVATWPAASVRYLPLDPSLGEPVEIALDFYPDNIRRTYDGRLAVTGHTHTTLEAVSACVQADDPAACAIDYEVAILDPDSLEVSPRYHGVGSQAFGAATIALLTRNALWLGAVRSSCIAKVPMTPQPR